MTRRAQPRALVALTLLVGVLVAATLAPAPPVAAHAVLVRSAPAPESRVEQSPASIELWFSEPLESGFSTFEVLDTQGRPRQVDALEVDPADPYHLTGLPRRLPPGVYTVAYRSLSQFDGHEWTGTFAFTVLNSDGSVPAGTAYSADLERGSTAALITARLLTFLGFSILVGGALLVLLDRSWRGGEYDALARDAAALFRRIAVAALPLLVGGAVLALVDQSAALDAPPLRVLRETRFGVWWLARTAEVGLIALVLAVAWVRAQRTGDRAQRWLGFALPLLAGEGIATITALSHAAAAPGRAWAILFDLVHFITAAVWVGGLIAIALLLVRGRSRGQAHTEALVRRWLVPFSSVAAYSIFVLTFTGVLRGFGELPTASALVSTNYGRWLLIKLGVILLALGVALLNRRALQRRTGSGESARAAHATLRRLVPIEAGIAVAVMLTVAVLGQTPTPRGLASPVAAATAGTLSDYNAIRPAGALTAHLQVSPARLGANQLRVHVYRPDGSDPGEITRVRLTLSASAFDGGQQIDAQPQGNGVFVAREGFFSLAKGWEVRVEVQRAGQDDVVAAYSVPITEAPESKAAASPFSSPAPQLTLNALAAFTLVMFGGGLLVKQGRRRGSSMRAAGALAMGAGLMLWVSGETHSANEAGFPLNPVPPDAASVARGKALFEENCVSCHGPTGRGDGPVAETLTPRPASLDVHMPLHPDGQAFIFISKGFPGTAMSAYESRLSEEQRWDLVNYLRALTTPQPQ